ncbi:hypothetical protein JZ751_006291, partial [Albula glossodonta]
FETTFITYISVKGGPVSSATGSITLTHFSQEPSGYQTRTCRCSKMATLDLKLWYWGTEEEHVLHWIHAAHHSAPCATCLLPNIIGTNESLQDCELQGLSSLQRDLGIRELEQNAYSLEAERKWTSGGTLTEETDWEKEREPD